MKAVYMIFFIMLLLIPVFAICGDHICTKDEYGTNCIDCSTSAPKKNWCIDDGICTKIERAYNCEDCQKTSGSFSGLATFVWGFSAITILAAIAVFLVVVYLVFSDKTRYLRRRRL